MPPSSPPSPGRPAADWAPRLRRPAARPARGSRTARQDALDRVASRRTRWAGAVVDALRAARAPGLDDAACLELALLVRDTLVRDVACALVTREDARRHLALWLEVVRRTPPELAPAPLCLVGVAAWAERERHAAQRLLRAARRAGPRLPDGAAAGRREPSGPAAGLVGRDGRRAAAATWGWSRERAGPTAHQGDH